MKKTNTAYFLDFDRTLFNTDEFFTINIKNAVLKLGVTEEQWKVSYEKVRQGGYTFAKHMKELLLSEEKTRHVLNNDLTQYVYADVVEFLEKAKADGITLFLVSLGNPEWQRYKIMGSQIDTYFKEMFFTSKEGTKAEYIYEYVNKFQRIVVVDDNSVELNAVKDAIPTIETYLIDRTSEDGLSKLIFPSIQAYTKTQHQHITCKTLDSIH